jgi:N-acetylmuramoyl-L-alanine amidase
MLRGLLPLLLTLVLAPAAAFALPRVVLDPGHGGEKDGAHGVKQKEKDLALQLAHRLRKALLGTAEVILTREDDRDLSLSRRVEISNQERADLFVSLHANSMPTRRSRRRTHGVETYFLSLQATGEQAQRTVASENGEEGLAVRSADGDALSFILQDLARQGAHQDASRLAQAVHPRLVEATGAQDRGVQQAPFFVLAGVEAPAILVEVGYITHPTEGPRLAEGAYQDKVVGAIAAGVKAFLAEMAQRESGRTPASTATAR